MCLDEPANSVELNCSRLPRSLRLAFGGCVRTVCLWLLHVQAVFEIKVSAPPPPVVVLSNMPLSHTHDPEGASLDDEHSHDEEHSHTHTASSTDKVLTEDDLIAYHFHATPSMSTYLVAWVVGELSHNDRPCELGVTSPITPSSSGSGARGLKHGDHEDGDHEHKGGAESTAAVKHNITVSVWGTSDRVQQFGHARDVACAALQEMEKFTQVREVLLFKFAGC